ncbi:multiheme c-type cytochrome [Isosphaeraceae bacterium EP7]
MHAKYPGWRLGMAGLALLTVLVLTPRREGRGQDGGGAGASRRLYVGAQGCAQCHATGARNVVADAEARDVSWVKLDEYVTWSTQDNHSKAYSRLAGVWKERTASMSALLGYDALNDRRCLSCHSTWAPEDERGRPFSLAEGVTCTACHGPDSGWILPHGLDPKWRTLPPAEKEAKGLVNLRDPVKRASTCLACHVGNHEQGKVLTHEMYAAGHPPLPGIEVGAFSKAQPRHWRLNRQNSEATKAILKVDPTELEETRFTVIAGVVSLRHAMDLLAATTEQGVADGTSEFGRFDCQSCHHELRRPSWRQARGAVGPPGRPRPPAWPDALIDLALHLVESAPSGDTTLRPRYDAARSTLAEAFSDRPFGDPARVVPASRVISAWSDDLVAAIKSTKINAEAGRRALARLVERGRGSKFIDPDAAKQLAWAYQTIRGELVEIGATPADPAYDAVMDRLDEGLGLAIPTGPKRDPVALLSQRLKALSDYDPAQFRRDFDELARLAPAGP